MAFWNAVFTISGMRFRFTTRSDHLVIGFMIATWSISWKVCRPY